MAPRAPFLAILLVNALSVAAIPCQPSAGDRLLSSIASPTPEVAQTPQVIQVVEIGERVETEEGIEIRRTIWQYVGTPAPPLEELVKIQKVEADEQIEIAKIEILPGFGL